MVLGLVGVVVHLHPINVVEDDDDSDDDDGFVLVPFSCQNPHQF